MNNLADNMISLNNRNVIDEEVMQSVILWSRKNLVIHLRTLRFMLLPENQSTGYMSQKLNSICFHNLQHDGFVQNKWFKEIL
ncbi:CLUMA_CG007873, isoform A [Clunio marinus]|uniref:CLUMA_CG007873, isoform A n=1 Tax=Clunio marinus TaxID=568069 RepID=A0A1J1I1Y9_9DIPT|nr:CLUMA_CG007873, isoform A [Clunio marinus]